MGGGQGAKFLVMTLCQVLFGTYFHTRKVKTCGQGAMAPVPRTSATVYGITLFFSGVKITRST